MPESRKYTGMILKGETLHLYESAEDMRRDMMAWKGTWENPGFSQSAWIDGVEFHTRAKPPRPSKWVCLVGDGSVTITTLVGSHDNPHDLSFEQCYDRYRTWLLSSLCDQPREIGGIYDKEFVFADDCQGGNFTLHNDGKEFTYPDEWNLLNNWPGHVEPRHPVAQAVWDRRKMSFWDARDRIQRLTDDALRNRSV